MLGIGWTYWIALFVVLLYLIYKWGTSTFGFFAAKGVPFLKPMAIIGNFDAMFFKGKSVHDFIQDVYNHFKDEK